MSQMDADLSWGVLLKTLDGNGVWCETRGTRSLEVLGYQTVLDMRRSVMTWPGRELGYRFQAGEAWWILSGDDRVETISPYSRRIADFSDDGVRFFGAYGPKIMQQTHQVVEKLTRDPESRQAVVNIWRENHPQTKDVPCTLSLQFLQRGGRLHCCASMRSSDAWLGWPYDVFNFSCVSLAVASMLPSRPGLGTLRLTAGSQHIYDRDLARAKSVTDGEWPAYQSGPRLPDRVDSPESLLAALKSWADGPGSLSGLRALEDDSVRT